MACRSATQKQSNVSFIKIFKNPKVAFAFGLIFMDALLVSLIIAYVPYTKIDWDAYMSQVSGFLEGERDYSNLKGDTGPLVYPAGFLYIYSAIQYITGGEIYPAQLPWWALSLLSLSKRVHSIFVLRLFNDCFAMTLLHAAVASLVYQRWHLGLIIFSAAVSIKMNVLLYAPPLLLLMLKAMSISGVISALSGAALVQILLGLPFLVSYPVAYISGAFNLGRVFIHFWHEGGLISFLHSRYVSMKMRFFHSSSSSSSFKMLKKEHIVTTMFVGNFIGIVCARSLHYQFYSWYFYSLPYLLWKTSFPTLYRLILFVGVEICWNVFPSNIYSSFLLLCLHFVILWGLWSAPPEYPYVDNKPSKRKQ